jgi:hypothetical protein
MSTFNRPKTIRQMRHPASRCESHRKDKREGEVRRATAWISVPAAVRASPTRYFDELAGYEYMRSAEKWTRCQNPEEFADYLEQQAALRSWYRATTRRREAQVTMTRRVAAPIEIVTVTFPPWLSDWTANELASKRDPTATLAAVRNSWLRTVQGTLHDVRHLVGLAFHTDTSNLHFDLAVSRQDGAGNRIGPRGLHLVGPWTVGAERQHRAGAHLDSEKLRQLKRNAAKFRDRYGHNAVPMDVKLARALDKAADEIIGQDLTKFRDQYALSVPQLERDHKMAKLAMLQSAEQQIRERLAGGVTEPKPARPDNQEILPC